MYFYSLQSIAYKITFCSSHSCKAFGNLSPRFMLQKKSLNSGQTRQRECVSISFQVITHFSIEIRSKLWLSQYNTWIGCDLNHSCVFRVSFGRWTSSLTSRFLQPLIGLFHGCHVLHQSYWRKVSLQHDAAPTGQKDIFICKINHLLQV